MIRGGDLLFELAGPLPRDKLDISFDWDDDDDGGDEEFFAAPQTEQNSQKILTTNHIKIDTDPNVCSICFDAFDDVEQSLSLSCGHTFCVDCLTSYFDIQTRDVTRVAHKMIIIEPFDTTGIAIRQEWRPSLQCCAYQCTGLIAADLIRALSSEIVFQRFERLAMARIELMQRRASQTTDHSFVDNRPPLFDGHKYLEQNHNGVRKCARCEEFAVTSAARGRLRCRACLLPYCARCELSHRASLRCGEETSLLVGMTMRQADLLFVQHVSTNTLIRGCPKCGVLIEKNGGCDHHYCTICHHRYNWSAAPRVRAFAIHATLKRNSQQKPKYFASIEI